MHPHGGFQQIRTITSTSCEDNLTYSRGEGTLSCRVCKAANISSDILIPSITVISISFFLETTTGLLVDRGIFLFACRLIARKYGNIKQYKRTGRYPYHQMPPRQINQVFMNLPVSAVQAIEIQGEISVRTWHENGSIFASVSDTGCGMPHERVLLILPPKMYYSFQQ
jgi:signal transduction histidine kinase